MSRKQLLQMFVVAAVFGWSIAAHAFFGDVFKKISTSGLVAIGATSTLQLSVLNMSPSKSCQAQLEFADGKAAQVGQSTMTTIPAGKSVSIQVTGAQAGLVGNNHADVHGVVTPLDSGCKAIVSTLSILDPSTGNTTAAIRF